jgi:hypothetical protein
MNSRRVRARPGVSEVVGALLLIIVVVTAVASLSYFLATAQQNSQNRSVYLTDLKNENFQVVYASLSQAWVTGTTTNATSTVLNDTSETWTTNQYVGYYLEYTSGPAKGQDERIISNTAINITTAAFNPAPTADGGDAFTVYGPPQGTWNQVVLSVRNTNTVSSGLQDILVNGAYITKWYQVSAPGSFGIPVTYLGAKNASLLIPAKATEYIKLNGSTGSLPGSLQTNEPLQITLVSQSGNYFTTNWTPPVALTAATVSPKAYQAVPQDELSLSGAQSYASNGTVVAYSWSVSVPNSCTSSTAFDTASNVPGETLAYAPEALFTNWSTDCITGPINATLTVTDSNGFVATSQPLVVPPDPALDPPAALSLVTNSSTTITVEVTDAYGRLVPNELVTAVGSGGLTVTPSSLGTGACPGATCGEATFTVSGTGSALFQAGGVPSLQVPF